jgi:hypothetical protein
MSQDIFADVNMVDFTSEKPYFFGEKITLLDKNKNSNEGWTANVLLTSGNIETIHLNEDGFIDTNLIVMRCNKQRVSHYLLQAIPEGALEKMIRSIEEQTMALVNS